MNQTMVLPEIGLQPELVAPPLREVAPLGEVDQQAFNGLVDQLERLGDTAPEVLAAVETQSFQKNAGTTDTRTTRKP
jgi:hypothetical protein